jgi:phosphoglycolate phosphatase-like HAD superfamily hydrolase
MNLKFPIGSISFDFDNTLFSAINSDYRTYKECIRVLDATLIPYADYKNIRYTSSLTQILSKSKISDKNLYLSTREAMINESFYLDDFPIVNAKYLMELSQITSLFIISRRENRSIIEQQINNWKLNYFERILITGAAFDSEIVDRKAFYLKATNSKIFVGDRKTDLDAAHLANVTPILVETGFEAVSSHGLTFGNVNDFIESYLHYNKKI